MRAIGRSVVALLVFGCGGLLADPHAAVVDLFASMSAALSEDWLASAGTLTLPPNTATFMKSFDRKMPGYDELQRNVAGILRTWEVSSSIEFLKDQGDSAKRSVDVDWYLELKSREGDGPTAHRREIIHCELAMQGKHWRIVSIQPVSLFKP